MSQIMEGREMTVPVIVVAVLVLSEVSQLFGLLEDIVVVILLYVGVYDSDQFAAMSVQSSLHLLGGGEM